MTAFAEKLAGRKVVASISGGKDSAAMSLFFMEQGIEHERVFLDTGWEHPATYDYLRGELTRKLGPITEIAGDRKMADLIRHKGMFPGRTRRFCTLKLKVEPMQKFIARRQDEIGEVVNAVGIRKAESEARSKLGEWEWGEGFDCETWRPILEWSEADVIAIHHRHGLPPNPLYLLGATRVGCWPCIFSRKEEIRFVADHDPDRIDLIELIEKQVEQDATARYAARGETFESLGYSPPKFFQARSARAETPDMWPIRDVVEWSRTSRGGKQFDLFKTAEAEPFTADASDAGCMRWGMCDLATRTAARAAVTRADEKTQEKK